MGIKAEIKHILEPDYELFSDIGKELVDKEFINPSSKLNKLLNLFAKYEAEIRKDEREKLFDAIYEVAPKDQFAHWKPWHIAGFFEQLHNLEAKLKDQSLTNKGE